MMNVRTPLIILILLFPLSASAGSLTVSDLLAPGNTGFTSLDGSLSFKNFSVIVPNPVQGSPNALMLSQIMDFEVEIFSTSFGFKVIEFDTPITAVNDQIASMQISFDVIADAVTRIDSVGLSMTAAAFGLGARVEINETITGANSGTTTLQAIREEGGLQNPIDFANLASSESQIHVSKNITLDVRDPGAFLAQISEFEQTFVTTVIPEPSAALLFLIGGVVFALPRRPAHP